MRSLSVIAYTATRCVPMAWTPGWLLFFLIISFGYPSGNSPVSSLCVGAAILLPLSIWMAVATFRGEDPVNSATHGLHYRSPVRYRMMVSAASFLASIAVLPVSFAVAMMRAPEIVRPPELPPLPMLLIMGVFAHLAAAAVGTAIGSWLTRPIVERQSSAYIIAGILGIGLIGIPRIPPVRLLTDVIIRAATGARLVETIAVTAASAAIAAVACWVAALVVPRRI